MSLDVPAGLGDTALHAAAAAGSVSAVDFLVDRGLPVDVRGAANRTPLMAAAEADEGDACAALLRAGAKPELTDNNGYRAVTVAADRGNVDAIRALAVYSRDYLDDALLLASLRGNSRAAAVLAEYGASVYARMDDGLTPLMMAAREGHAETVRVLLEQGANRYAVDADGRTAGQIAAEANHLELAVALNRDPGAAAFSLAEVPELAGMDDAHPDAPGPEEEGAVIGAVVGAVTGRQGEEEALVDAVSGEDADHPAGEGADLARAGDVLVEGTGRKAAVPPPAGVGADAPEKLAEQEDWEKEMLSGGGEPGIEHRDPGNVADSRQPVPNVDTLVMETYHEKPLPLQVEGVEGDEVRVRYLYGDNKRVTVKEGQEIPFTGLRVVKVEQRHDETKMSRGRPLDVSSVWIEDPVSGRQRELIAKLGASAHEPFAVLRPRAGGEPMIALQGGVLRVPSGAMYVVQDVRPSQVVLENAATGEVHTVGAGTAKQ